MAIKIKTNLDVAGCLDARAFTGAGVEEVGSFASAGDPLAGGGVLELHVFQPIIWGGVLRQRVRCRWNGSQWTPMDAVSIHVDPSPSNAVSFWVWGVPWPKAPWLRLEFTPGLVRGSKSALVVPPRLRAFRFHRSRGMQAFP